ncbi:POL3 protein, partial [Polypterus senegalus]|nr:POL3 protein [Polypterus senegalus]
MTEGQDLNTVLNTLAMELQALKVEHATTRAELADGRRRLSAAELTDASDTGLGAVMSQSIDGVEHPVMYLSRKLLDRETRYAAVEREALAIKWAVKYLRKDEATSP